MQKKSKLPIILLVGVILIALDYWYCKVYKAKDVVEDNIIEPENNISQKPGMYDCGNGYTCEMIGETEYKWTTKTMISINNMYDYDTDEMEAGTLEINEGKLTFKDLTGTIRYTYDEIEGSAMYIEESIDLCDEKPLFIVLTTEGKLYMSDAHSGILVSNAFTKIDNDNTFTNFMTKVNSMDYTCTITEIYARTGTGEVIKLVSNENVTE